MENKLYEVLPKVVTYMKDVHNLEYSFEFKKHSDPLLVRVTFYGVQPKKIVVEVLENGSMAVLQTTDVVYSELAILMEKFLAEYSA